MSKLGKIFLFLAFAGALAAAVAGYLLIEARGVDQSNLATAQQKAAAEEKAVVQAKSQVQEAQTAEKTAEQKASDDDSKITDLNNQLTTAQKDAADAHAAVKQAQDDAKAAADKLADITTKMGGKTPDDFQKEVDDATKNAADAQSQLKIVQDQAQQDEQKIKDLMADINMEGQKKEPPGVSGKVTFVDRTWNFVVLDVGLDAGVVPNGELIVYRGKTFLGKIRVTRADPNDSVAEILPDIKGNIQVGDAVLN